MGGEESKPTSAEQESEGKNPVKPVSQYTEPLKAGLMSVNKEFDKQIESLLAIEKKTQRDLERMIKKGEPKSAQRTMAQKDIKGHFILKKYQYSKSILQATLGNLKEVSSYEGIYDFYLVLHKTQFKDDKPETVNKENIEGISKNYQKKFTDAEAVMNQVVESTNTENLEDQVDDADADELIDQISMGEKKQSDEIDEGGDNFVRNQKALKFDMADG